MGAQRNLACGSFDIGVVGWESLTRRRPHTRRALQSDALPGFGMA